MNPDPSNEQKQLHCFYCGCVIIGKPFIGENCKHYCPGEDDYSWGCYCDNFVTATEFFYQHNEDGERKSIKTIRVLLPTEQGIAFEQRNTLEDFLRSALNQKYLQEVDVDDLDYPELIRLAECAVSALRDECLLSRDNVIRQYADHLSPEEIDAAMGWAVKFEEEEKKKAKEG